MSRLFVNIMGVVLIGTVVMIYSSHSVSSLNGDYLEEDWWNDARG